jgi:L-rhamnose mutarotase
VVLLIIISHVFTIKAQKTEPWTAFWDDEGELIGFKDADGKIVIEPKFYGITTAYRFNNIIAVWEDKNGEYLWYYLTKDGKIVGRDSLWIFDNIPDCESEGFIRFKDKKNDKVGLFDAKGRIAIPAEYDELTRVMNGMMVGLKGSRKKYLDKEHEYYQRSGGRSFLINTKNEILIEDFEYTENLNFFSLKVESKPGQIQERVYFMGVNGRNYSFVDYEKEFLNQLKKELLNSFTEEALLNASYDSITFWDEENGWIKEAKMKYIQDHYTVIKNDLDLINTTGAEYSIFIEDLNSYIFNSSEYERYFNDCIEFKTWQYPLMNIMITHYIENDMLQNHFGFLRTDTGYKLISVSIRTN